MIHFTSKHMDGHAIQVGGVIVASGKFEWKKDKFPDLTEPDPSYHGISYTEVMMKLFQRETGIWHRKNVRKLE